MVNLYAGGTSRYCGGNTSNRAGCSYIQYNQYSGGITQCDAVLNDNADWTDRNQLKRFVLKTLGGCLGLGNARAGDVAVMQQDQATATFWITPDDTSGLQAIYGQRIDALPFNGKLIAVKKSSTGTNSTEVHIIVRDDPSQRFALHTGTVLHETGANFEFAVADYALRTPYESCSNICISRFYGFCTGWARVCETAYGPQIDGYPDIWAIKKSGTGTGHTEVHVLNGAGSYQNFLLQTPTALGEVNDDYHFEVADFNRDGYPDLYVIQRAHTASGNIEIHILNGANNFQTFLLYRAQVPHGADDINRHNWDFVVTDVYGPNGPDGIPDVIGIARTGTGSGMTEVLAWDGASNYAGQDWHIATGLGPSGGIFEFAAADYDANGFFDLIAIQKSSTGTESTEIHVLDGQNSFQNRMFDTGTILGETGDSFTFFFTVDPYCFPGYGCM